MGLRERKKERTSRAIEDAAVRLFAERGFHETTIANIADAAEIAPRTFFSYFPSKESVLFADFDEIFAGLQEHMDERDQDSVLEALRGWIVDLVATQGLPDEREIARQRIIDATQELQAFERQLNTRFESVIAAAAAADMGTAPDDLHPRLVATSAAAALNLLRPNPDDPPIDPDDPLAPLDEALAFLAGGMAALEHRRAQDGPRTAEQRR